MQARAVLQGNPLLGEVNHSPFGRGTIPIEEHWSETTMAKRDNNSDVYMSCAEPSGMIDDEFLLLNPGPVPVTRRVREAMDAPMVSHRSAAFEALYERAQDGLDYVFEHSTPGEESTSAGGTSLVLNGTATMGMEAAVANLVGEGDEVIALVNGKFGRRFARIAERYASVTRVEVGWGDALGPDSVAEAVTDDTDLVTMVHNETSTGVLNPVPAVGGIVADYDARFVVDGVTSIGGDVFRIDDWNVDVAITDSQKALAAPPGISAMYVTDRVVEHVDGGGSNVEPDPFPVHRWPYSVHRDKSQVAMQVVSSCVPGDDPMGADCFERRHREIDRRLPCFERRRRSFEQHRLLATFFDHH